LGRIGGEALTFASDLDLVYLFSGTHEAESDGPRPLRANDYFNRLAPRVTAALSVPTAAGPLYEVDTRLRPNGKDGMLAVSLESFEAYQREQAWTWEHMALLRSRPVYGSDGGSRGAAAHPRRDPAPARDPARITADAVRMRREIAAHKPATGPFDIKHGAGGLIDSNLPVHLLQLRHRIGLHPRLEVALAALHAAGFRSAEVDPALRFAAPGCWSCCGSPHPIPPSRPAAIRPLVARACGLADWTNCLRRMSRRGRAISTLWRTVIAN
jgi:glutamate-ammonia-ligase adenylyltransferase